MLSKLYSAAISGLSAYLIEIEVDIARGLPAVSIVGLPDTAVKESKDRVRTAIKNSGFPYPSGRITINLAPADIKKEGPCFDLAIALGILAAQGKVNPEKLQEYIVLGELNLNGEIKPVKGVLPIAIDIKQMGKSKIILPPANAGEAAIIKEIEVYPLNTLSQTVHFLNGEVTAHPYKLDITKIFNQNRRYDIDFSDVRGQDAAKRALEVAAAGQHNLLMLGPPGSGKTMLAKRLPTLLPDLTLKEALETTKIYSIMGLLQPEKSLIATRPFRAPHHTISDAGLIGGGSTPKPGEISLAHNGVLFLDELPEFHRNVLEVLRQPLEDGYITISRAVRAITYPARFMIVAAMNPCPCGYFGSPHRQCHCTPHQIQRYRAKISGPLLDRIDIHIEVPALRYKQLARDQSREDSATIKKRIASAHKRQKKRFSGDKIDYNSQMNTRQLKKYCPLDKECEGLLKTAIEELNLSARAYHKIIKVSRTIADLAEEENIKKEHLLEAIQYRSLDQEIF
ncbi:MAG: YifB family Mg chelatase-like AAA ATPase [Candidatus Omnitrophica bacterium]|nr:YifB family Mg chelatase-like AAA ATPase [Candidatus Omnitrophota bacterium]